MSEAGGTVKVKAKQRPRRTPDRSTKSSRRQDSQADSSSVLDCNDEHGTDTKCKLSSKDLPQGCPAISCEKCDHWICQKCARLDDATYTVLTNRLHWYCSNCESDAFQASNWRAKIEERCRKFLSKYECQIAAVEEKLMKKLTRPG